MVFVNKRLIVNEEKVEETVRILQKRVQKILDNNVLLKDKGFMALVEYEDEVFSENTEGNEFYWKQYTIQIIKSYETHIFFEYSTDGLNPTLVYGNGKFEFYYVFECRSTSSTHPIELINTARTNSKYDFTIEHIIENELNKSSGIDSHIFKDDYKQGE